MMRMKRNYVLLLLLLCLVNGHLAQSEYKPIKHDILLIIVDDLRHLVRDEVNLPHIRKLAAKGVNFKNAFAQQALCAPSRNSFLTGRRPDALRSYDVHSYWRNSSGNFFTLPQYFKENGYETYAVGKVFHPGASSNFNDDYPYSWSEKPYHPSTEKFKNAPVCEVDPTSAIKRSALICPVDVKDQPEHSLPDLQSLQYATKILEKNRTKPYFLAVGLHKPHIPLKYPKEFLGKVPENTVRPPIHPKKPKEMPIVAWQPWVDVRDRFDIKQLNIPFPMGIMPENMAITIKRNYYAAALYMDDIIGKLLRHIDYRKTIVVLTSDHGWSLGENGLWAKYSNFDVALKVPLIIRGPGIPHHTIVEPVELIDIFPTLANLADLPYVPKCAGINDKSKLCFDGKSLVSAMFKKKHYGVVAISQYPRPSKYPQVNTDQPALKDIRIMGYSIRTNRFRFTEWISFIMTPDNREFKRDWDRNYGVELYDHESDSEESVNLHLNPKYNFIESHLSKQLRSLVESNNYHSKASASNFAGSGAAATAARERQDLMRKIKWTGFRKRRRGSGAVAGNEPRSRAAAAPPPRCPQNSRQRPKRIWSN